MCEKRESSMDFVLQPRKKQLFVKEQRWKQGMRRNEAKVYKGSKQGQAQ